MPTNYTNRIVRVLSILMGLILVGIGAYLNCAEVVKFEGSYTSPLVVMVVGLAFASALAAIVIPMRWRDGSKGLAVLLLVGLLGGETYAFWLTAERVIAGREAKAGTVVKSNQARLIAIDVIADAKKDLASASMLAASARSDKRCDSACQAREAQAEERARKRLTEAQAALATTAPLKQMSPIAETLGIPAAVVEIVPALAAPLALLILGLALIASGCGSGGNLQCEASLGDIGSSPDGRREAAMAWIRDYREKHGQPPRFHVVRDELGLPKATASRYLRKAGGE